MKTTAAALILSGGSEIVSLAIAEALHGAGIAYAVASLVRDSLLRGAPGCVACTFIGPSDTEPDQLKQRLLQCLMPMQASPQLLPVVFATEDGGLRLLNEYRDEILPYAGFARARALRLGGLDKAELFTFLENTPAVRWLAPTLVLDEPAQAELAFERFGDEVVFKPSLKPWDMQLGPMAAKVITRADARESRAQVRRRLDDAWYLSRRWLAQRRLVDYADGEHGAWALRSADVRAVQFVERWKYPRRGGSGCWVETVNERDLLQPAAEILDALDFVGLAELPFLQSADGCPQLLELNPRAWLQVGLAERCGFGLVAGTLFALRGGIVTAQAPADARSGWVNIERLCASVASGDGGARLAALRRLAGALATRPAYAVYGSTFPRVRQRWLGRMGKALLVRIGLAR